MLRESQVGNLLPVVCIVYLKLLHVYPLLFYTFVNLIFTFNKLFWSEWFFVSFPIRFCILFVHFMYAIATPFKTCGLIEVKVSPVYLVLLRVKIYICQVFAFSSIKVHPTLKLHKFLRKKSEVVKSTWEVSLYISNNCGRKICPSEIRLTILWIPEE